MGIAPCALELCPPLDLALFYAIFPTRKGEATGWEPVTRAWINDDVWVERFGSGFQVSG